MSDVEKDKIADMAARAELADAPANSRQVGGGHYAAPIQHWDFAASQGFDYFQGQITKYVTRWRKKNGIQDLEKALHFLQKYIETEKGKADAPKCIHPDFNRVLIQTVAGNGWRCDLCGHKESN